MVLEGFDLFSEPPKAEKSADSSQPQSDVNIGGISLSGTPTIMIVDDDPTIQKSLSFLLKQQSFKIMNCESGKKAVEQIAPDVSAVILDIKMEGMNGFETCDEIRKLFPKVPIIFHSAYQDLKDPFSIMNEHYPFGFIGKGDDPGRIVSTISRAVKLTEQTNKLSMDASNKLSLKNNFSDFTFNLLSVFMENAGVEIGALLLAQDGTFLVEASAVAGISSIKACTPESFENNEKIPQIIIEDVIKSGNRAIFPDPKKQAYAEDSYIKSHQPSGAICIPIKKSTDIFGILYLESKDKQYKIGTEVLSALNLLAILAASTLQNALLYRKLQDDNSKIRQKVEKQSKEIKMTYEELQKAKEEAELANEFKSQFLAQMTHDLRTPLHVIIGTLDTIIKQDDVKNTALEQPIDIALKSGERQLTLVNDILDLSKIESGKMEVNPEPMSLNDLLSGIPPQVETLLKGKPVKFVLDNPYESENLVLMGDKKRLGQIITNLLSNASKFTEKGEIKVAVRIIPLNPPFERVETVSADQDISPPYEGGDQEGVSSTQRISFEISDTGIGMTPENAKRVFESYVMIENDIQKKVQGTGLGLSICKGFTAAMGGDIWAESEPDKGTTFKFWFPYTEATIEESEADTTEAITAEQLEQLKTKKVILCDDDEFNRMFAQMIMEGKVQYELVEGGQKALDRIKAEHFDMALVDLEMPEMNGHETRTGIRKINKNIPIVAMTAKAMKGVEEELLAEGFTGYFPKPFKEEELVKFLVSELLT